MEKSGQTGDGTLEHFNSYKYAPSRPTTQQSHTIFVTNGSLNANHSDNNYPIYNTNGYAINKIPTSDGLPVADC